MWARQIGITLIESLVVIAIIAILSGIAMSSFQWLREAAQQKRVIHQLQAAVLTARHLSVIKAAATYVCPSPEAVITAVSSMPECGDDYSSGVAIWTDQAFADKDFGDAGVSYVFVVFGAKLFSIKRIRVLFFIPHGEKGLCALLESDCTHIKRPERNMIIQNTLALSNQGINHSLRLWV